MILPSMWYLFAVREAKERIQRQA